MNYWAWNYFFAYAAPAAVIVFLVIIGISEWWIRR